MRLIILGAGGYGKTVADLARQSKIYDEVLFLDDEKAAEQVLGSCNEYLKFADSNTQMYPAFGNNTVRLQWIDTLEQAGISVPSIFHPSAYISPTAVVEHGVVVLPNAVVNTDCVIQKGCILNCGALIDHDCVLEQGVHVCLGAIVKGENRIPQCCKIEAGEVIPNRTYI